MELSKLESRAQMGNLKKFESLASNFIRLRNDYADVTGISRFPLPFCGTRRIEDEQVAVRAIEIWCDICHLCSFWQSLPESKRSTSQSYLTLLSATKDPVILGKLHFLYSWYHKTIYYRIPVY